MYDFGLSLHHPTDLEHTALCSVEIYYLEARLIAECCSVSFDGQVVDYPLGNFQIPGIPCNEYICDAENGFSTVAISK